MTKKQKQTIRQKIMNKEIKIMGIIFIGCIPINDYFQSTFDWNDFVVKWNRGMVDWNRWIVADGGWGDEFFYSTLTKTMKKQKTIEEKVIETTKKYNTKLPRWHYKDNYIELEADGKTLFEALANLFIKVAKMKKLTNYESI